MSSVHLLSRLCARLQTHFVESKWGVGYQVLLTKQFYSPILRNDERVGSHLGIIFVLCTKRNSSS